MRTAQLLLPALVAVGVVATASANPPPGVFTEVSPVASRYPVTLKVTKSAQGLCTENFSYGTVLVDLTGKESIQPFVVPEFHKFVLTDVEWAAHPDPRPAFAAKEAVSFTVTGKAWEKEEYSHHFVAQRSTDQVASGSHTLTTGIAFVAGTTLCANALAMDPTIPLGYTAGIVEPLTMLRGFIMDDDAKAE